MDWACSYINAASLCVCVCVCVYVCQQVRPVCQRSVKMCQMDWHPNDRYQWNSLSLQTLEIILSLGAEAINKTSSMAALMDCHSLFFFLLPFLPHPHYSIKHGRLKCSKENIFLCCFVKKHSVNYTCIESSLFNSLSGTRGRWCVMEIHSFETTCCTFAFEAFVWKSVCLRNSSIPKKSLSCHNPQPCRASSVNSKWKMVGLVCVCVLFTVDEF